MRVRGIRSAAATLRLRPDRQESVAPATSPAAVEPVRFTGFAMFPGGGRGSATSASASAGATLTPGQVEAGLGHIHDHSFQEESAAAAAAAAAAFAAAAVRPRSPHGSEQTADGERSVRR